ncbi:hypothetical protein HPB51_000329 [Rhipicephalus microplus]|uniref:Uncharacterized protein n=1 Tax=Rhipicephalus microplus TaxID=6941 RepID=A0A9J6EPQ0_RHIMP|nr:hypothetical protein HPB51_000329 [Rhipicephalus microplus]
MESIAPETEQQVSPSVFSERGDARAIVDCAEDDCYRPVCTSSKDQVCQISNGLPYCNRLLFDIGLELREQRGGSLSLVTIDVNLEPLPGPESCRAIPFLRWLLQNHVCITTFDLWNSPSKPHGKIVLQELPENYGIKNLTLQILEEDGSAHTHVAKHLPRLSSLETLSCSDVFDGEEPLFSALAKYIRETTVLQKLRLTVTSPQDPEKTATSMCLALLFASMAANTSISDLDILTNGSFRHNDCLTRIIRHSSYISRVSFQENTGLGNATKFVSLLSEAIGDNYVLLELDLHGAKVGVDAKWCFFAIRETTRRNCGLVERAAAFNKTAPLDCKDLGLA